MSFIKLDRKLKNWPYYNDPVMLSVWIHLMMESCYSSCTSRFGVALKEGQFITSQKKLADQCGISRQQLRTVLNKLEKENQIKIDVIKPSTKGLTNQSTNRLTLITLINWEKYQVGENYQPTNQPSVQPITNQASTNIKRIIKEDDRRIKEIYYVVSYLNDRASTNFRPSSKNTKSHINARLEEGYTIEDFKKVIDVKCEEWLGTDMAKYLRPGTLFGTKFESYLNQKPRANPTMPNYSIDNSSLNITDEDIAKYLPRGQYEEIETLGSSKKTL